MTRGASSRESLPLVLAALLAAACGAGAHETADAAPEGTDADGDTDTDTGSDTLTGPGAVVRGLLLTRVELCQTVCTALMIDGAEVAPAIPIVPGRSALVRVHVRPLLGWNGRSTWAELEYETPGVGADAFSYQLVLLDASSENDLDSTINFVIPGEHVADGLTLAFALRENGGFTATDEEAPPAVWPAEGAAAVPVAAPEAPVEIVVVPVRYGGDGSGRLPDTSPEALAEIEALFTAMYPIDRVQISVAEAFDWGAPVLAGGDGWNELLVAITEQREAQGAAFEEYYYGLFDPADTFGAYCGGGCILGLSYLAPDAASSWARSSIGVGFGGGVVATTMVHEVGHAHGLGHAPCGTSDPDPAFPYADGSVGVTGWDELSAELMSSGTPDFMSYCDPDWVSDYHYLALYDRIAAVNAAAKGPAPVETPWRSLLLRADGSAAKGPTLMLRASPAGPALRLVFLDAAGAPIGSVEGRLQRFSDTGGGLVIYPPPPVGTAMVELPGGRPIAP